MAKQCQVLAKLLGCPHERTNLMILLEESLQDMAAEESGCARQQDEGHGTHSFACLRTRHWPSRMVLGSPSPLLLELTLVARRTS